MHDMINRIDAVCKVPPIPTAIEQLYLNALEVA